ncbi:ferredoxin family protein [Chitiniphilus purpureus]|uniref:Ferredoxin family protein n=1 Tax=Chitiniphilus purpureus TaxID=2981137 RepID=A0ABY6DSN0_9NEIS|nr:ferredoxin family protein [Chitiniphilus sp. CD1]UXY16086.1 ferredoxin family protein [Chitiniphilus sp. CD1]
MIELISAERCINCDLCVQICPTNVFDVVSGDNPVIARQHDCQTCFMCEAYCPVDALYVAPFAERTVPVVPAQLEETALLGSYRRALGWSPGGQAEPDQSFRLLRG